MRHGSLFSGIGGFDLAAEWAGWENIFHCEWNYFGQKILHHYWPNAIQYNDITKTDFTIHRGEIDILTGGFPCQPYSTAGKRLGKEDDRHLWPHMRRAIQEIQPRWVVGENVLGLVNWNDGLVFQEVCADLEAEGYEVQPFVLPAASKGAPHSRQRVWFVAYSKNFDALGIGRHGDKERKGDKKEWTRFRVEPCDDGKIGIATDTKFNGLEYSIDGKSENKKNGEESKRGQKGLSVKPESIEADGLRCDATDTNGSNNKAQPQERILGQTDKRRKTGGFEYGNTRTQWNDFPTQSPICGGDDGLPTQLDGITFSKWRNESIKGYGNAIVPQVAYTIFETINAYERPI